MKKLYLLIILFFCQLSLLGQVVTTQPLFPVEGKQVVITFDATKGSGGLQNYTGDVYAHTGVITDLSNGNWTYVKADWNTNKPECKMTSLGNNKYSLTIPDIRLFYGVPANEKILKLAFVFRGSTGSPEGKGDGGTDIFCPVYESGLHVLFTNPENDMLITSAQNIPFNAITSDAANINLYVNNALINSATNATSISSSYNFTSPGSYTVKVEASLGAETVTATRLVTYKGAVTYKAIPDGMQYGINYAADGKSATLVLYTPIRRNYDADKVTDIYVIGDFNNWTPMSEYMMYRSTTSSGYNDAWWVTIPNLTPGKEYGFQYLVSYVNGTTKRIADPYCQKIQDPWNDKWINQYSEIYPGLAAYPEDKTTDIVSVLQPGKAAYNWQVTNFITPMKNNMVVYELLLRDFTSEKSLKAAIDKLDYLKNLGVNAVELMPITEFDGNNSWGYNPCFYFAPDKAYGTEVNYKQFIDECHKRGIAVILDMVLNHATGNNPMAKLYWNSTTSKTSDANPWFNVDAPHPYSVFSDFKHGYVGTKDYFKRVMKYWIQEFNVDGYRLDLSKGLTDNSSTEATAGNYDQTRINNITEYYNAAKEVKPDVLFILEHFCADTEEKVLSDTGMILWNNMNGSGKSISKGTNADLSYMNVSTRTQVAYLESHDEERVGYEAMANGVTKNDLASTMKQLSSEAALFFTVPGAKMIWQFGELGYDYSIYEGGDRMTVKPVRWDFMDIPERIDLYKTYSRVLNLRLKYPNAFTQGSFTRSISSSDWDNGKSVTISHNDLNVVEVSNLKDAVITSTVTFPKTGVWYDLMTGNQLNITSATTSITVPAHGFLYYIDRQTTFPSVGIENVESYVGVKVYYDNSTSEIKVVTDKDVKNIKVYSINGVLVKTVDNQAFVEASGLSSGCYLVRTQLADGTLETFKILK
jgi:1,4-alpha-glucan branching enzyme